MSQPFVGEIRAFGFNFAPRGWQQCNGQTLSISANAALFALLGTTYGGNGTTTFNLPDLRGRVAISQGQGPSTSNYVIGEAAGTETVTLLSTQMPQHTHTVNAVSNAAGATVPTNALIGEMLPLSKGGAISQTNYSTATANTTMNANMLTAAGGSQPHANL